MNTCNATTLKQRVEQLIAIASGGNISVENLQQACAAQLRIPSGKPLSASPQSDVEEKIALYSAGLPLQLIGIITPENWRESNRAYNYREAANVTDKKRYNDRTAGRKGNLSAKRRRAG